MAYCPSCGKEVQPDVAFCPNCGHQLMAATSTQPNQGISTVNTAAYVQAYRTPIFIAIALIGASLIGIGVGIYAVPGHDLTNVYCGPNVPFYPQLCNQGQNMIVNGVALALVGLIMLIFASSWYVRRTHP